MSIQEVAARIMAKLDEVRFTPMHEIALKDGIMELAVACGTELKRPHNQTAGELAIVTTAMPGEYPNSCRPYGEQFAALFNGIKRRTGEIGYGYYTGEMLACNGWCYVPYWEVEQMIRKASGWLN